MSDLRPAHPGRDTVGWSPNQLPVVSEQNFRPFTIQRRIKLHNGIVSQSHRSDHPNRITSPGK